MNKLRNTIGALGLALLLSGGILYGILYTSGIRAALPLAAGLLLSAASLVLSYRKARTEGRRRVVRFGLHTGASIVFLAAILMFLQTIVARHAVSLDTTANRRFSLSPQTERVLGDLSSAITVVCFFKATDPERLDAEDRLKAYARSSRFIRYRFVDPDGDPATARRYRITKGGSVVVEGNGTEATITGASEEKLTNAIIRVTRGERRGVCFTMGHGERSLDGAGADGLSALKETLEAENRIVRSLVSGPMSRVPDDCDLLVVAGPEADLSPPESEAIAAHLDAGGNALFFLDPLTDCSALIDIAASFGIAVGNDIILPRYETAAAGPLYPHNFVKQYTRHAVTEGFRQAAYFPRSRSVSITRHGPAGVTAVEIAMTAPEAYAETDLDDFEGGAGFTEGVDRAGPVPVVALSSRAAARTGERRADGSPGVMSRLVVFGDSDCATNEFLLVGGNRDLILNAIAWLAEEEDFIAIRPREALIQPVVLSPRQDRVVFWLPVIGLPVLVLVIGLWVGIAGRRSA